MIPRFRRSSAWPLTLRVREVSEEPRFYDSFAPLGVELWERLRLSLTAIPDNDGFKTNLDDVMQKPSSRMNESIDA